MTYLSLLVIGAAPEQLDSVLDPFMKNPKNKRYANFSSMDQEIRDLYETGMVQPSDATSNALVAVRERYDSLDAFVAAHYPYAEKNEAGLYGQYENPNGKYSYFVVGGRNNGFFQLCEGGSGELAKRNSHFDPRPDPNTADITLFKFWDREQQATIQAERAVKRHRYFFSQLGDIRLPVSSEDWRHFFQEGSPLHGYDLKSIYTKTEAEYAAEAASRANVSFAVLKDGVIYERQFNGAVNSPEEAEEFQQWARTFAGLIDGLAPDTPLIALTAYE